MAAWLGKGCEFQCCQWEENEMTGGPNYREAHPALIMCGHEKNPEDTEGNCRAGICPLPEGPNLLVLDMDGSEHTLFEVTGCCQQFGRRCPCGGWMHYQPVYGGYFYQCEKCKKTDY